MREKGRRKKGRTWAEAARTVRGALRPGRGGAGGRRGGSEASRPRRVGRAPSCGGRPLQRGGPRSQPVCVCVGGGRCSLGLRRRAGQRAGGLGAARPLRAAGLRLCSHAARLHRQGWVGFFFFIFCCFGFWLFFFFFLISTCYPVASRCWAQIYKGGFAGRGVSASPWQNAVIKEDASNAGRPPTRTAWGLLQCPR